MSGVQIASDNGIRQYGHTRERFVADAGRAAKTVFEACGGAVTGWKFWTHPSGRMQALAQLLAATALDDDPNQSTYDLYTHVINFPCNGRNIPYANGNLWRDDRPVAWEDAPAAVQGAYDAFRGVYLQLWLSARSHDEAMARARPVRGKPRLVHDKGGRMHGG